MNEPLACTSTSAALEPIIPTERPQTRFTIPTMKPTAKTPYAILLALWNSYHDPSVVMNVAELATPLFQAQAPGLPEIKIAMITP